MKQFIFIKDAKYYVFGSADPHDSLKFHMLSKYIGLHGTNNVIQTSGMNNIVQRSNSRHFNGWSNERTVSTSF